MNTAQRICMFNVALFCSQCCWKHLCHTFFSP